MPRAMWSGSISFGLVNVPVKLYPAVRDRSIHFHMLSKDGQCRLRRRLVCPETGDEYEFKNTTKGYEIAPDQYVIVREEELDSLRPEAGRTIEITDFVDLEQIDPVYYDRPYYLAPDEQGAKAYQLLVQAMTDTNKVGIAKFVMRRKEYLAALRPVNGVLCLETMNFADEVAPVEDLPGVPVETEPAKRELQVAEQLIRALSTDFEPQKYHDEYREKLMELVEKKAAGEEIITHAPAAGEEEPRIINLRKALEESLKQAKKQQPPSRSRGRRKSA